MLEAKSGPKSMLTLYGLNMINFRHASSHTHLNWFRSIILKCGLPSAGSGKTEGLMHAKLNLPRVSIQTMPGQFLIWKHARAGLKDSFPKSEADHQLLGLSAHACSREGNGGVKLFVRGILELHAQRACFSTAKLRMKVSVCDEWRRRWFMFVGFGSSVDYSSLLSRNRRCVASLLLSAPFPLSERAASPEL